MAPIPLQHPLSIISLATVGIRLISILYLIYAVAASLYTSYKSLGPSQDTRSRLAQRKRLVPIFLGLAVTAFSLATYTSLNSVIISYRTWVYEHGLDQPERFIPEETLFPEPDNSSVLDPVYIAHWLSDTSPYFDSLEIVAEKARRFWWGQQIDLATIAFSFLLSIEGRRRNIPLTSAFLALAHLVSLSFAQNLFFLALLLTPAPLSQGREGFGLPVAPSRLVQIRDRFFPRKPKNWYLSPGSFGLALAINYSTIFLLPLAAETPSFVNVVFFTRASTFLPLILPRIAPTSWGTIHAHPHDAYRPFTTIYRSVSFMSFVYYAKATIIALIANIPNSHRHRHSVFFAWDMEERTNWERSSTAVGKVLGSIFDHPAVLAVGWDVLICTFSLGLWAAVRATNTQHIIYSTYLNYGFNHKFEDPVEDTKRPSLNIKPDPELCEDVVSEHSMTLRSRRKSTRLGSVASSTAPSEEGVRTPGKRRGRSKKTKKPEEEKSYEPTPSEARDIVEGDILPADKSDWESGALAWGIAAFSGLGSATAGVFGAECVSR
ncbi:uncharacterized protein GGS22DRAFT_157242 [Annulohypoxylon maeteangense]|uniref:uncharacterized protein n=1 Tax=Annulohypoxylon maeteangense TaxID=1927788 RepID=UPI0020088A85|nr:uncharacterized protein GGS22DRAFT_157242 [Annulohypoxylon maeteangense]KAI0887476.1 hypothetical protein GGS22DRAFT_157242 [Annulohypoxylon maeteangense]